jgi:hypothetical protein
MFDGRPGLLRCKTGAIRRYGVRSRAGFRRQEQPPGFHLRRSYLGPIAFEPAQCHSFLFTKSGQVYSERSARNCARSRPLDAENVKTVAGGHKDTVAVGRGAAAVCGLSDRTIE